MRQRAKNSNGFYIITGLGLVLLALALGTYLFTSTKPIAVEVETQSAPFPDIPRIGIRDAKQAFDAGDTVFLDVRDTDSYSLSHIPGAIFAPVSNIEQITFNLDRNKAIITYCT